MWRGGGKRLSGQGRPGAVEGLKVDKEKPPLPRRVRRKYECACINVGLTIIRTHPSSEALESLWAVHLVRGSIGAPPGHSICKPRFSIS